MRWIKASERVPDKSGDYFLRRNLEVPLPHIHRWVQHWNVKNISQEDWIEMGFEWLDESDHSDEEAAFNAGRWIEVMRSDEREYIQNAYGYPTFTDYLKSKQEL